MVRGKYVEKGSVEEKTEQLIEQFSGAVKVHRWWIPAERHNWDVSLVVDWIGGNSLKTLMKNAEINSISEYNDGAKIEIKFK